MAAAILWLVEMPQLRDGPNFFESSSLKRLQALSDAINGRTRASAVTVCF
ncbi:hypothetical protein [Streptomyces sp. NPDC058394]